MNERDFLRKVAKAGQLEAVEPSKDICGSYEKKASDCLKAAQLLLDNGLYENSISESYYAVYDSVTALLRRAGVKCENHAVSISLLKTLFDEPELMRSALKAKEARIDSQYYVDADACKDRALEMLARAENFFNTVRLIIRRMTTEQADEKGRALEGLIR